jgi:hypothetical protein
MDSDQEKKGISTEECRCTCGLLHGIRRGGELHVKYKEFAGIVRGRFEVRCRRCGRVDVVCTERGASAAA